jgi:hypothetical protein
MPKAEDQDYKDMEKETVVFHGKTGKVSWIEFEKSIARYFRMKFGSEIGDQLWGNPKNKFCLTRVDRQKMIGAKNKTDVKKTESRMLISQHQ